MKTIKTILNAAILLSLLSCKNYLDIKPDEKRAVPSDKIQYLQMLLDDATTMNLSAAGAADIGTDDYNIPDVQWNALYQRQLTSANAYIWDKNLFNDLERGDWANSYKAVFNANLVLESLDKLKDGSDQASRDKIKGAALFFRAHTFYQLLQEFSLAYEPGTASHILGIPLKMSSDINEKTTRADLETCYQQILSDLNTAKGLLPAQVTFPTSPSKTAALAVIAKVQLVMKSYDEALINANACLDQKSTLLDYNGLNINAAFPITLYNPEVIYHSVMTTYTAFTVTYGKTDQQLYDLYKDNDLRKLVFYKNSGLGNIQFKGSYTGTNNRFNGITTAEIYLIKAECLARTGDIKGSMDLLNLFLQKRTDKNKVFIPYSASGKNEALNNILTERRKELAFRNVRWSDLKRLNTEPDFKKTLFRTVNNKTYALEPDDSRYALSIPSSVISLTGIPQN